ncbi:universal stress protein [Ferruginibacter sp. HRS2-29]|uniref:universal stress protein n=1 Tax=Ferruginibacter sp. HRS2-29 TaxID=2487334 RepID=UPI0020CEE739|nr:universal stress protein [Ferruginibacter sp. HRS2-29]MCP9753151.1 universal stress protein [Ferruginibacter sp. HRS2-29]
MKKILVLTDFSDPARHAAEYAVSMAADLQAEVTILHVYQIPLLMPDIPCDMSQDDLQKITVKELDLLAEDLRVLTNNKVTISTEIRTGSLFVELMYACAHMDPYLVVMGSYGNMAARYMLLGSHTLYCMKHLPYPLLAVPVTAQYKPVERVCFVIDENEAAYTLPTATIVRFCSDLKAALLLLSVTRENLPEEERLRNNASLMKHLSPIKPEFHQARRHHRDADILAFCEKSAIDVLIVAPVAHSILDIFYKNNIRQFITHSNLPILVLHKKLVY